MMPDIEKVINALELCYSGCFGKSANECHYSATEDHVCIMNLIIDAAALLKAMKPRVLTLEEACGADECWLERKGFPVTVADVVLTDRPDMDIETRELNTLREYVMSSAYYGTYWRCWSARPTDEQREAAKWDG